MRLKKRTRFINNLREKNKLNKLLFPFYDIAKSNVDLINYVKFAAYRTTGFYIKDDKSKFFN
ncbi:hypothetical protein GIHI108528_09110 [Gillisia hiemivivida]